MVRLTSTKRLTTYIRACGELAAALEVSGWPKPGNVHRTRDYPDTRFEHFLAGSIALGLWIERAANKGILTSSKKKPISSIEIGKLVKNALSTISDSHLGGNTHLGIALLFIPLAAATARSYTQMKMINPRDISGEIRKIMKSTTSNDALNIYEAIAQTTSPSKLGKVNDKMAPDLYDPEAKKKILTDGVTLYDAMKVASSYDTIALELTTGMSISFKIGYPQLTETWRRTHNINISTVHTFLKILSCFPDTHIARKIGNRKINDSKRAVEIGRKEILWISKKAEQILTLGALTTGNGKESLWEFDSELRNLGKDYNPGTTADLTAASLMIALLDGLKF